MPSVEERVCTLVAQTLAVARESITLESSMKTIDTWDSLATVNLLIAVENEFGISVDIDNAEAFSSVRGIIDVVSAGAA